LVSNAVFPSTIERMVPNGDFQGIFVVWVAANLGEGVAECPHVDAGAGFVVVVELPSGV
jgi:hypothetical protein